MNPKTPPIKEAVAGGLFHCTSLKNLKLILKSGAIHPNRGQFPSNHGLSPHSRCRKFGGISLFDLTIEPTSNWFLYWLSQSRFAIKLNRDHVSPHLVNPWQLKNCHGVVLLGEVCCSAPIPVSAFAGYVVLGPRKSGKFAVLESGTDFQAIKAEAKRLAGRTLPAPKRA